MEEWRGRELFSLESSPGFCLPSCWLSVVLKAAEPLGDGA